MINPDLGMFSRVIDSDSAWFIGSGIGWRYLSFLFAHAVMLSWLSLLFLAEFPLVYQAFQRKLKFSM